MLRKCPHHGLDIWQQGSIFYNGLLPSTRQILDSNSGGILGNRRPTEIYEKIEEITQTSFRLHTPHSASVKKPGLLRVDQTTALQAQIEALSAKMKKLEAGKSVAKVWLAKDAEKPTKTGAT
jgi:hypothetical protein